MPTNILVGLSAIIWVGVPAFTGQPVLAAIFAVGHVLFWQNHELEVKIQQAARQARLICRQLRNQEIGIWGSPSGLRADALMKERGGRSKVSAMAGYTKAAASTPAYLSWVDLIEVAWAANSGSYMTDDQDNQERLRVAAAVRKYIEVRGFSREQFAFKVGLSKSTIDKLLIGLFSGNAIAKIEGVLNSAFCPTISFKNQPTIAMVVTVIQKQVPTLADICSYAGHLKTMTSTFMQCISNGMNLSHIYQLSIRM